MVSVKAPSPGLVSVTGAESGAGVPAEAPRAAGHSVAGG